MTTPTRPRHKTMKRSSSSSSRTLTAMLLAVIVFVFLGSQYATFDFQASRREAPPSIRAAADDDEAVRHRHRLEEIRMQQQQSSPLSSMIRRPRSENETEKVRAQLRIVAEESPKISSRKEETAAVSSKALTKVRTTQSLASSESPLSRGRTEKEPETKIKQDSLKETTKAATQAPNNQRTTTDDVATLLSANLAHPLDSAKRNPKPTSSSSTRTTGNSKASSPAIPHTLFFTYHQNILETGLPRAHFDNIWNTIDAHRQFWDEPHARVRFLTDGDCRKILQQTAPQLVTHFDNEYHGKFKADICRIAALYQEGGYYFDIDIQTVTPVPLADDVTFATATSDGIFSMNGKNTTVFFQAFLASAPKNAILEKALYYMRQHYEGNLKLHHDDLVGPSTLRFAHDATPPSARGKTVLLQEGSLDNAKMQKLYPDVPRQSGTGCCCNFVVHNPENPCVYFFSRAVLPMSPSCNAETDYDLDEMYGLRLYDDDTYGELSAQFDEDEEIDAISDYFQQ